MVTKTRSRSRLHPEWLIGAAALCGCSFELPAVAELGAGAGVAGSGAAPGGGAGGGVAGGGVAGVGGGGAGSGDSGVVLPQCAPPQVTSCTKTSNPRIVVPAAACAACYRPILAADPVSKDGWIGIVVGDSSSTGSFAVIDRFGENLTSRPGTFPYQSSSRMIAAASGRFALASKTDLWLVDRCGNDVWHHTLPPQSHAPGDWEVDVSAFGDDVWLSLTLDLTELNVGRLSALSPASPLLSPISKITCCNGRTWSLAARANGHAEVAYHGPGPLQEPASLRALALVDLPGSTAAEVHSELGLAEAPRFSAVLSSPPRSVVVTGSSVLVGVRDGSSYAWQPPVAIEPFDVSPHASSNTCAFAASEHRVWRACLVGEAISVREIKLDPGGPTELELASLQVSAARTGPALAWDGQGLAVAWREVEGVAYAHLCAP